MRIEDTFLIQNKLGLHARAATVLAQLAVKFDASITLFQDDNAHSSSACWRCKGR